MSPPANPHVIAIRPRSLVNVRADLIEAQRDVETSQDEIRNATLGMHSRHYDDLQDRATEAETRLDDLRDEWAARFLDANGMTYEDALKVREQGLA